MQLNKVPSHGIINNVLSKIATDKCYKSQIYICIYYNNDKIKVLILSYNTVLVYHHPCAWLFKHVDIVHV